MYDIQIVNSKKYKTLSDKNQIDLEIIFPLRGEILDRNKKIIATNLKVFDLYIIPEKTDSINNTLNSLSKFIPISFTKRRKVIDLSKKVKKFEKIKLFENINWETYHTDLPFNPSALSLYKWAPIADELKVLDKEIVLNSIKLKWNLVENEFKDLTKNLAFNS